MIDMQEFEQEFVPVTPGYVRKATPMADGRHRSDERATHSRQAWVTLAVWVALLCLLFGVLLMFKALMHEPLGDQATPHPPVNVYTIAPPAR